MKKAHILVVEDDRNMGIALTSWLQHAGYRVTQAPDGETAIDLMEQHVFDVVLTDLIMGSINGIEVLQTANLQAYRPEVIVLTGHGSLDTSLAALRARAYDYLLKPCNAEQVLACVEGAIQRRLSELQIRQAASALITALTNQQTQTTAHTPAPMPELVGSTADIPPGVPGSSYQRGIQPMQVGELFLGDSRHEVLFRGKPVRLTPIEYTLLTFLAQQPGQMYRCRDIVHCTHGVDTNDTDAQTLLRSHIHNLRKKLDPAYLVNDRGSGYMLVNPDQNQR